MDDRRRASDDLEPTRGLHRGERREQHLSVHRLGAAKYAALGLPFPLADTEPPPPALMQRVRGQFRDRGLTVY